MIEIDRFNRIDQPDGIIIIDIKSMYIVGLIKKEHQDKVNVILHALKQAYGPKVKVDSCQCGNHKPIEWAKCHTCRKSET
jgi:hypothetical protein